MNTTALIMAGGRGERFWPRSRRNLPKQFLSLTDDGKTMIQLTVERILPLVKMEDIYIATNKNYRDLVRSQLPEIPEENILCEPVGRNTAPCIGLGAAHIGKKYEDALMLVLPSDHLIKFNNMFLSALRAACQVAGEGDNLVTLGNHPHLPGDRLRLHQIQPPCDSGGGLRGGALCGEAHPGGGQGVLGDGGVSVEQRHVHLETVLHLEKSGEIYAGDLQPLKDHRRRHRHAGGGRRCWSGSLRPCRRSPSTNGIMEKAEHIYTIPGTFGWDDVGSWLAVERIKKTNEDGNVVNGNVITIDTHNCIIQGKGKLIASVGLRDLIIVDTDDAILICEKHKAGDIRKVTENLKICNRG